MVDCRRILQATILRYSLVEEATMPHVEDRRKLHALHNIMALANKPKRILGTQLLSFITKKASKLATRCFGEDGITLTMTRLK